MTESSELLERLLFEMQQSVSCSSRIVILGQDSGSLSVRVGSGVDAVISITIDDITIPSFAVTYPKLRAGRTDPGTVIEKTSTGILSEGVLWITRKIFRFGFVPPEGYKKDQRNSGNSGQD